MEDFDVFTNEIKFTKESFTYILNRFASEMPTTPNSANYQSCKKLQAEESLIENKDDMGTFYLSESVSASLRTLAVYRDEQIRSATGDSHEKFTHFVKPIQDLLKSGSSCKEDEDICPFLKEDFGVNKNILDRYNKFEDEPFHRKYLRFSSENNIHNFQRILKELPKEWTILQLTVPYNPNENLKPFEEYRNEIPSIYVSVLSNEYLDDTLGPFTVQLPANVTKVGEVPLFIELYSLLDDSYDTIKNAQSLNKKQLLRNYWDRREDIDLRMKSAISVMERDWFGGWKSLLTGKLLDTSVANKIKALVDDTISDWGFIQLTNKQKVLLYNLIESSHWLTSSEIKSTVRKILTECGNIDQMRKVLSDHKCTECDMDFKFLNELCIKCLAKCFQALHKFTLVDGIKAFSDVATQVKITHVWADLKMAKRHPVILIVDELLDTFPWESLSILNIHPVCRIENIHFLYYLYKTHEQDIVDGYMMAKPDVGRYVINPDKNLDRMEKRMSSFVQYWCPQWLGEISKPPEPDVFLDYVKQSDLLLYCGHGSGCQLATGAEAGRGAGVETARGGRALALLAGCGSVRLSHAGGRTPPAAAHHHYHIANIPMVVGMLWEVTDLEVDKVVTTLLSLYVPSVAPVPWDSVGKAQWSQGILDINVEQKSEFLHEEDLLRAIALSRRSTKFLMIATSIVARGIPVKISKQQDV